MQCAECGIDNCVDDRVEELVAACRAVLDSLQKLAADGEIIWLDPPHVLPGVHESAIERLKGVLEL